jgi:hypothetical protein
VNVEQLVRRVLLGGTGAHRLEEPLVSPWRRRRDVLEIAEHAAGFEERPDLRVQLPLPPVLQMVDGEAGDDRVERPERRQRPVEVVLDDLGSAPRLEACVQPLEHDGGKLDRDPASVRPGAQDEIEQAPIAGPEVEDATDGGRNLLEQRALSSGAVRDAIGALEICAGVVARLPLVHVESLARSPYPSRTP